MNVPYLYILPKFHKGRPAWREYAVREENGILPQLQVGRWKACWQPCRM